MEAFFKSARFIECVSIYIFFILLQLKVFFISARFIECLSIFVVVVILVCFCSFGSHFQTLYCVILVNILSFAALSVGERDEELSQDWKLQQAKW